MSRSPNYPSFSLPTAIDYADKAYVSVGKNSIDSETFFTAMGYSGKSGASMKAIAALRAYGLVAGRGDDVQLSNLYMRIAKPLDAEEKTEALREALNSPKLFAEILVQYENLPSSDILRSVVIRKYDFNESGAKKFVKNLSESIDYVEQNSVFKIVDKNHDGIVDIDKGDRVEENTALKTEVSLYPKENHQTLKFQLGRDTHAEVVFVGEVSSKTIEHLILHLNLTKAIYSEG